MLGDAKVFSDTRAGPLAVYGKDSVGRHNRPGVNSTNGCSISTIFEPRPDRATCRTYGACNFAGHGGTSADASTVLRRDRPFHIQFTPSGDRPHLDLHRRLVWL